MNRGNNFESLQDLGYNEVSGMQYRFNTVEDFEDSMRNGFRSARYVGVGDDPKPQL